MMDQTTVETFEAVGVRPEGQAHERAQQGNAGQQPRNEGTVHHRDHPRSRLSNRWITRITVCPSS